LNVPETANLGIRFVVELCMLAALAYWGSQTGEGGVSFALAIAAPLAAAWVWGTFVSPKAARRLERVWWIAIQGLLFGAAAAALISLGHGVLGVLLGAAFALNLAALLTRSPHA
jgi:hypothetical protein